MPEPHELMSRLTFGRLTDAWRGEASDFTPLLAQQVDTIGDAIGVDLASIGQPEVVTLGARRIDIVAQDETGAEVVIENQYGRGDHDHLTRGLAYAVGRRARSLVVVAEEHRDEFRAVAEYLNDLAALDQERGIHVWLVEARAVRIGDSPWAPLFTAVVKPNDFAARVESAQQIKNLGSVDDFLVTVLDDRIRQAAHRLLDRWLDAGYRYRLGPNHVVLEAPGPAAAGIRNVVTIYAAGDVKIPFASYAGSNTGLPIEELSTESFRREADQLFGLADAENRVRTDKGWLNEMTVQPLLEFCLQVADCYRRAQEETLTALSDSM